MLLYSGMNEPKILTADEIETFLSGHSDWRYENQRLLADYTLPDFATAMSVVTRVANVAEEMDHHPLWTNVYNRLTFSLCTHRTGDTVTELDVALAERISDIVARG